MPLITNMKTDALIISSHSDPSLKWIIAALGGLKLGKKKKHLKPNQNKTLSRAQYNCPNWNLRPREGLGSTLFLPHQPGGASGSTETRIPINTQKHCDQIPINTLSCPASTATSKENHSEFKQALADSKCRRKGNLHTHPCALSPQSTQPEFKEMHHAYFTFFIFLRFKK